MSYQAFAEEEVIDLDAPRNSSDSDSKPRRWWAFFQRSERPNERPTGGWFGRRGSRNQILDEFREERQKLVDTIEELNQRIDAGEIKAKPSMELDPMPVIEGIKDISSGQKQVTTALQGLSAQMERSEQTDVRLADAVTRVDKTLSGVKTTQTETVGALVNVGEKIDHATLRFEDLFERMSEAEKTMAEDYRKLQHRTLYSIAMISAAVIIVLCLFMTRPWI